MAFSVNNAPLLVGANVTPLNTPLENQIGMVKLQQVKQLAIDQEKQRQTAAAFQQALRSTSGDYDAAASMLDKQGYDTLGLRNSLADYRDKLQKGATAHIDQMKKEHDMMSSLFADVDSPEKFSAALPIANRIDPEFVKMLGPNPTYNPQTIDAIKSVGISAADHLKMADEAMKDFTEGRHQHGLALAVAGTTSDDDLKGALQYAQAKNTPSYLLQKYQGVKWSPELVAAAKTEAIGPEKQAELDAKANAPDKVQSAEIEAIKAFTAANGRKPTEAELDGIHKRFKEAGTVVRVSTGGAGGSMETPTIKPGTALYRTAQDLAYGKLTFSQLRSLMSYNRNSGQKIALYDMARQLNPQFNPAQFEMGYKFAGNPKTQNTLVSIDNALSNFDKAVEVSDALDRTDLPSINRLLASGKFQFGSKPVTNFQQLQTILGDDIALAIGQGAPSDYKTKLAQSLLNGNLSKENFISTLRQAGEFLQNRKQSILKQEGIYGTPEFNPSAAAVVPKVMGGSTAPAYQVGQVVTVKGQKVKITNVLPNGQFQGLPVQ